MLVMLLPMDPGVGTTIGGGSGGGEVPKLGGIRIRCTHPDRVVGAGGCATGWTAAAS